MKRNLVLTCLAGGPISLLAIWMSVVSFGLVINSGTSWEYGRYIFLLLGIGGLWAVFTGLRNLLRFDSAHRELRWHDWVGGIFGFLTNALLIYFLFYIVWKHASYYISTSETFVSVLLCLTGVAPFICFGIVAYRFFTKNKTCK